MNFYSSCKQGMLCYAPPKFLLVMKLTVVLLITAILQVSAEGFAQRITLNQKNSSLESIFKEIRKQSGYDFFYSSETIRQANPVDISVVNAPLDQVLKACFAGQPLTYTVELKTVIVKERNQSETVSRSENSLPVNVRGRITDEKGEPLPGATIRVKATGQALVSDGDGRFSFSNLNDNAVLVISYTGFVQQEVAVKGRTELNVVLQPDQAKLNEVVVTALGIKKAEASLGYSVEEVKGETLEKVKTDKLWDQVNGKVAGLRVNSRSGLLQDAGITLRGRSPLYVVNGNPVLNSFRGIPTDDIESITVLKGPQASVLYGSKGIDGAVLITTKTHGKGKDLEISVNSSSMITAGYLTLPETQSIYGQGEFGQYAYKDGKGGGTYDDIWVWGPKLDQPDPNTPSGYWETPQYNSPIDPQTGERIPTPWVSHPNNLKNMLTNGVSTNNNISVAQQFEKGSYRVGLNQMYRKGMIPNTDVNQLGLSMGGDYSITKKLRFTSNLLWSNLYTQNYPPVGYANDQVYYNTVMYMGANTDIRDLRNYWEEGQEGYQQYNFNHIWFQNPWFLAYEYLRPYSKKRVVASASLDYTLGKNTNILLKAGHDNQYTVNETKKPYAWVSGETGAYSRNTYDESLLDVNLILTSKQKAGGLGMDFMAGANWNELVINSLNGATNGGLIIPGIYNFSNSQKEATVTNYLTRKRMYGLYGSATFDWKSMFYLTLTGRNDWSSALIKGNRSYFYPSVSASTVISEIVRLPEPISFLKLRGSWVKVGRDMDAYNLTGTYSLSGVWGSNPAFAPGTAIIDPNIKPSMTDSYEAGIDVRFLNNRLRFDLTYFNTLDEQWIQSVNIPVTNGYSTMLTNGNAYLRDGYELVVSGKPVVSKDFNWTVSANWFKFKTVLDRIYNNLPNYGNLKYGDRTDAFYAKTYVMQPGTNNFVVGSNGLQLIDNFNRNIGNKDPKWEAGISNTLNYKDLSLKVDISGRYGGLLYSQLNARMIETGMDPRTAVPEREGDWTQTATYLPQNAVKVVSGEIIYNSVGDVVSDTRVFAPTTTPVMFKDWMRRLGSLGGQMTKGWNVYDASFLKIRSVALTYDLDDLLKQNKFVKRANVSLIGSNLFIWKKIPNEDPDGNVETLGYPTERYLGLNFSVTF